MGGGHGPRPARATRTRWSRRGSTPPTRSTGCGDGAIDLVTALVQAPDGPASAPVFLRDAPAPREFWARRQCHETTIHAVDALAAQLGRLPRAADAEWIAEEVALDGIDELLTGFVTRPRSRLRSPEPHRIVVLPDTGGGPGRWTSGRPPP